MTYEGKDRRHVCRFPITDEEHAAHHEVVAEAMEFLRKLNKMKWGVAQGVVVLILAACILSGIPLMFMAFGQKLKSLLP